MIKYKIGKTSIVIGNNKKVFENSIKKTYEYNNILIVILNFDDKLMDNEPNVYGFSDDGTELWEIELIKDSTNKYIDIKEEKGKLVLYDIDHFKYVLNESNGTFEKKRIMPLKDIDDNSNFLFTKTNLYQLIGVIFILFLLLSFLKSLITIKPSNEDYEIENTTKTEISSSIEKSISISNEEEVNVDELVQEVIQQELENRNENIFEYVSESLSEPSPQEEISSEQTTAPTSNQEDEEKYKGINIAINIFDKIIGAIETGKPTTIEDVNNTSTNSCTYIETLDGTRIKVNLNGEEVVLKLISVKENDSTYSNLSTYLSTKQTLYIEQDTKKKDNDGNLLVYLYTSEDNSIDNMVNFYLIHNGYASYEMQSPNIKYNYKLQK